MAPVTMRAERHGERVARLTDQVQSSAEVWARAEYQAGMEDGRHGLRSVHVERQRDTAEERFRDVAAKLAAAVSSPTAEQASLPLREVQRWVSCA